MEKTVKKDLFIMAKIDRTFKSKVSAYAKKKGVNLSSLVRQSLEKEMTSEFQDDIKTMLDSFIKENKIKLKQLQK